MKPMMFTQTTQPRFRSAPPNSGQPQNRRKTDRPEKLALPPEAARGIGDAAPWRSFQSWISRFLLLN